MTKEEAYDLIEKLNNNASGHRERIIAMHRIEGIMMLMGHKKYFDSLKDIWDILGVEYKIEGNHIYRT